MTPRPVALPLFLLACAACEEREVVTDSILGEVLREAQAEGIVRVLYERQQPVYHVTVASPLAR